ncbi:MAG: FAD-dependent oxidoreductase [Thermodesulfobacteriota bacterium]
MKIVIIGGSFGGLTVAFELKRLLTKRGCEITVISSDPRFVFIPSLPWVAMGKKTVEQISFDLERPLTRKGIHFVHATVRRIDAESQRVYSDEGEYVYDFLVIATGHRSANEAVPGLGPFDGPGHSLMSPPEAEEARDTVVKFLQDLGPMVIGCAPGASCLGPAYEFAFEIDHLLKKRKQRHEVPITFVTPEPFLGHFGVGGFGKSRQFLEGEFDARDIRYLTSAAVSKITDSSVELADGKLIESHYSLIIPPLGGVKAISDSPGLGNPKGFIPVDDHYCHRNFPNVYAVGVAVGFPPVEETPVPVNFPKTGHMTEQMGVVAAHNIAAEIQGSEKKAQAPFVQCIMDMGDSAILMVADPVRSPRNFIKTSHGKRWLWAKRIFAHYYLWKMKSGFTKSPKLVW